MQQMRKSNILHLFYHFIDVSVAKRYDSYDSDELHKLKSDVEAIYAHDGGDCPELGMEGILMALKLSFENSHVIVLTDAGCKDCENKDEVVSTAMDLNVKIYFFFSASGYGDFAENKYVQEKTGGIFVSTIESFRSLSPFISDLRSEVSSRIIRSVDSSLTSSHKCQTFNVSTFTTKFELIVNENSTSVKILDPLGYNVKIRQISDDLSGYISNEQPRNGSWNICTIDENSQFTITKKDIKDFGVDYCQDGYCSASIPIAGMYITMGV